MMKPVCALTILLASAPTALAATEGDGGGFIGGLMYSLNDPVTHVAFLALTAFLLIAGRMGAFKTVLGGLDGRAEAIRAELAEAASLREQAAAALVLAERRQQEAERDAEAIIAQARRDAQAFLDAAKADLADKITRREAQAAARIARAEAEAANDVRRAAADAATEAARRVMAAQTGVDQFEAAAREIEKALS